MLFFHHQVKVDQGKAALGHDFRDTGSSQVLATWNIENKQNYNRQLT